MSASNPPFSQPVQTGSRPPFHPNASLARPPIHRSESPASASFVTGSGLAPSFQVRPRSASPHGHPNHMFEVLQRSSPSPTGGSHYDFSPNLLQMLASRSPSPWDTEISGSLVPPTSQPYRMTQTCNGCSNGCSNGYGECYSTSIHPAGRFPSFVSPPVAHGGGGPIGFALAAHGSGGITPSSFRSVNSPRTGGALGFVPLAHFMGGSSAPLHSAGVGGRMGLNPQSSSWSSSSSFAHGRGGGNGGGGGSGGGGARDLDPQSSSLSSYALSVGGGGAWDSDPQSYSSSSSALGGGGGGAWGSQSQSYSSSSSAAALGGGGAWGSHSQSYSSSSSSSAAAAALGGGGGGVWGFNSQSYSSSSSAAPGGGGSSFILARFADCLPRANCPIFAGSNEELRKKVSDYLESAQHPHTVVLKGSHDASKNLGRRVMLRCSHYKSSKCPWFVVYEERSKGVWYLYEGGYDSHTQHAFLTSLPEKLADSMFLDIPSDLQYFGRVMKTAGLKTADIYAVFNVIAADRNADPTWTKDFIRSYFKDTKSQTLNDITGLLEFLEQEKATKGLHYAYDLDEDKRLERLYFVFEGGKELLERDGKDSATQFDFTFNAAKYAKSKLGLVTSVDHHGHTAFVAGSFIIGDETNADVKWVMDNFEQSVGTPGTMLTDGCAKIAFGISSVFGDETTHNRCIYHIWKNFQEHFRKLVRNEDAWVAISQKFWAVARLDDSSFVTNPASLLPHIAALRAMIETELFPPAVLASSAQAVLQPAAGSPSLAAPQPAQAVLQPAVNVDVDAAPPVAAPLIAAPPPAAASRGSKRRHPATSSPASLAELDIPPLAVNVDVAAVPPLLVSLATQDPEMPPLIAVNVDVGAAPSIAAPRRKEEARSLALKWFDRLFGDELHTWHYSYTSRRFTGGSRATQRQEGSHATVKKVIDGASGTLLRVVQQLKDTNARRGVEEEATAIRHTKKAKVDKHECCLLAEFRANRVSMYAVGKLKDQQSEAQHYSVVKSGDQVYAVSRHTFATRAANDDDKLKDTDEGVPNTADVEHTERLPRIVDMRTGECSCGFPTVWKLACRHVFAVFWHHQQKRTIRGRESLFYDDRWCEQLGLPRGTPQGMPSVASVVVPTSTTSASAAPAKIPEAKIPEVLSAGKQNAKNRFIPKSKAGEKKGGGRGGGGGRGRGRGKGK